MCIICAVCGKGHCVLLGLQNSQLYLTVFRSRELLQSFFSDDPVFQLKNNFSGVTPRNAFVSQRICPFHINWIYWHKLFITFADFLFNVHRICSDVISHLWYWNSVSFLFSSWPLSSLDRGLSILLILKKTGFGPADFLCSFLLLFHWFWLRSSLFPFSYLLWVYFLFFS